jgi:hypothetical protein
MVEIGWSSSSKPILLVDHFNLWLLTLGCAAAISRDSCLKGRLDKGAWAPPRRQAAKPRGS